MCAVYVYKREGVRERERESAYIEAGCPIEQLYDMPHTGLAGHGKLILQSLNNKHHYVLPGQGVAILKNLTEGGGERKGGREEEGGQTQGVILDTLSSNINTHIHSLSLSLSLSYTHDSNRRYCHIQL